MPKKKCFVTLSYVMFLVLSMPELSFARGIVEEPRWEAIEISDNFTWYNVFYNQKGEKIGLEETINPMYGQNILIVYREEGLETGKFVRISVYDVDMEYVFSKNVIIENGEIRAEVILLSNRQKMGSLETERDLQYFCIVDFPNSKKIRSKRINVNLTVNVGISLHGHPFYGDKQHSLDIHDLDRNPGEWDFDFIVQSTDGEYEQSRNVLRDGIGYDENGKQKYIFTDILLNRNYKLIHLYPDGSGSSMENLNPLDYFRYYDE
jgi:hypothetical protein